MAGLKDHRGINSLTLHTGYVCFKNVSPSHTERASEQASAGETSAATAAETGFDLIEAHTERTNGPF